MRAFSLLQIVSVALAQLTPMPCPPGTTLGISFQNLTISTAPLELYPYLGDFYSPSWQHLISDRTLTFAPPNRTFTIASQAITETLLQNYTTASAFHTQYALASGSFWPLPDVLVVAYDVSVTALLRICVAGPWSQVVWKTAVCVAGEDARAAVAWLERRDGDVVGRLFASVAEGWALEGSDGDIAQEARCVGANYTSAATGDVEEEKENEKEKEKDKGEDATPPGEAVSMLDGENMGWRVQVQVWIALAVVGCLIVREI